VGEASGEDATSDKPSDSSVSLSVALADAKLEMLTLTARFHSAENELKEKTVMNQRLDEELSKCRAEIGRLRTVATKNEVCKQKYWVCVVVVLLPLLTACCGVLLLRINR
jgi:hypothetical protein